MIFVYPALSTAEIKDEYILAISKTIEEYFLLHIQEAIVNQKLKFKSTFNEKNKNFGPIEVQESILDRTIKNVLNEAWNSTNPGNYSPNTNQSQIATENDLKSMIISYSNYSKDLEGILEKIKNQENLIRINQNDQRNAYNLFDREFRVDPTSGQTINRRDALDTLIGNLASLVTDLNTSNTDKINAQKRLKGIEYDINAAVGYILANKYVTSASLKTQLAQFRNISSTIYQAERDALRDEENKQREKDKKSEIDNRNIEQLHTQIFKEFDAEKIDQDVQNYLNQADFYLQSEIISGVENPQVEKMINKFERKRTELEKQVIIYRNMYATFVSKLSGKKYYDELLDTITTIQKVPHHIKDKYNMSRTEFDEINELLINLHASSKLMKQYVSQIKGIYDSIRDNIKVLSRREIEDKKIDEEKKKKKEKELDDYLAKLDKLKVQSTYRVTSVVGIDPRPSMSSVDVVVEYQIDPKTFEKYKDVIGFEFKTMNERKITSYPIGVKVIPSKLSTSAPVIDILINDYFSGWWRMRLRGVHLIIKHTIDKILDWKYIKKLKDFYKYFKLPEVKDRSVFNDIFKRKKDSYIDGSTFIGDTKYIDHEKIAAAVVILRVEDLAMAGDEFFYHRSGSFQKMFKMGWNSMAFLDEVEQKVYFISYFEGGNVYVLPYSLIFKNLNMDDVYKNLDLVRRHAPSRLYPGGISALMKNLNKRFLKESIDKKLNVYNNQLLKEKTKIYVNRNLSKYVV